MKSFKEKYIKYKTKYFQLKKLFGSGRGKAKADVIETDIVEPTIVEPSIVESSVVGPSVVGPSVVEPAIVAKTNKRKFVKVPRNTNIIKHNTFNYATLNEIFCNFITLPILKLERFKSFDEFNDQNESLTNKTYANIIKKVKQYMHHTKSKIRIKNKRKSKKLSKSSFANKTLALTLKPTEANSTISTDTLPGFDFISPIKKADKYKTPEKSRIKIPNNFYGEDYITNTHDLIKSIKSNMINDKHMSHFDLLTNDFDRTNNFDRTNVSPAKTDKLIEMQIDVDNDKIAISNNKVDENDSIYEDESNNNYGKLIETWVADNFLCPCCFKKTLRRYSNVNMAVVDLVCVNKNHNYSDGVKFFQVKSSHSANSFNYFDLSTQTITTGSVRCGKSINTIKKSDPLLSRIALMGYICIYFTYTKQNDIRLLMTKSFIVLPKNQIQKSDNEIIKNYKIKCVFEKKKEKKVYDEQLNLTIASPTVVANVINDSMDETINISEIDMSDVTDSSDVDLDMTDTASDIIDSSDNINNMASDISNDASDIIESSDIVSDIASDTSDSDDYYKYLDTSGKKNKIYFSKTNNRVRTLDKIKILNVKNKSIVIPKEYESVVVYKEITNPLFVYHNRKR